MVHVDAREVRRCSRGPRGSNRVGVTHGGPSLRIDSYWSIETYQVMPLTQRALLELCPMDVPLTDNARTATIESSMLPYSVACRKCEQWPM